MTYYATTLAVDVEELHGSYSRIASETMRCAPPEIDLHPDRAMIYAAVTHGYAYVARDEKGIICGAALIWPDGHVKWLTLPPEDSIAVMEALLNHYKDTTGISPWGEIANERLRETVYGHSLMHIADGRIGIWRKD